LCTLLYTSGSTGRPKGVELTFRNLTANALASVEAMEFGPQLRVLACLPTFHTFAITATTLAPLLSGASVFCLPRFDPELALAAASRQQCNVLVMVASMFRLLARRQESRKLPMGHLRLAVSGAEPLPAEVRERFEKVFGIPLLEGYGMTEAAPVIAVNRRTAHKAGTVGLPLPGVRVKIVDPDTLAEQPHGATGEIWVHGANVMRGYHNRPAATAEVLTSDGWLRTGDMGLLDAEGFLKITGRRREMVKVGGEMVFPGEVEDALLKHPAVLEAGVVGVKDPLRGESVKAFVVLNPGQEVAADELRAHCRKLLAPYKAPRTVEFRAALPKSPTGKTLRRLLK
jgi:long-chain acyl-CoA synthetase